MMPLTLSHISKYLSKDIPYRVSRTDKIWTIICMGAFTAFFLLVFQPFGVNNYNPRETISAKFLFAAVSMGVVVTLVLFANEFFLRPLIPIRFTLGMAGLWLVWTLLFLASMVFLYYNFLGNWHDMRWASYGEFIVNVSLMAVLPLMALLFYFRQKTFKEDLSQLHAIKRDVRQPDKLLLFTADNQKDSFAIQLQYVLYIEAYDNYAALFYLQDGLVKKKLLRSTLKRWEQELSGSSIVRCHRSFMVNIFKVVHANGNTHGLKLKIERTDKELPVSRNYTKVVLNQLKEKAV